MKSIARLTALSLAVALLLSVAACTATTPDDPADTLPASGTTAPAESNKLPGTGSTTDTAPALDTDEPPTEAPTEPETNAEPEPPTLPADAINAVTDWGLSTEAGAGKANSLLLLDKLNALPDGATVYLPEGTYEVAFPLFLQGKKQVRLVGYKATLLRTGATNTAPTLPTLSDPAIPAEFAYLTASTTFIYILDNENVTVEGLRFLYDTPTSLSGRIVSVEGGTATVEITDGSPITGEEYVTVINTFTEDGIPDRTLEQYAAANFPLEKLDEKTVRITGLDPGGAARMKKGTRVCLRLCTGRDFMLYTMGSTDTVFRDLTLENAYSGGIIMNDRCVNATLENVTVRSSNPEALMSLNADILHVAGLGGTLTVDGCHFERPGDDCINVHSMAYTVESTGEGTATLTAPIFSFSSAWAAVGDTLSFYDGTTFEALGTATITAIKGHTFTFDALPAGIKKGTVVANSFMSPAVTVRNTAVKYNRARGFLLQSNDVTVEDCTFFGTALAAILVAPDLSRWFEMAPAQHMTIRNNTFEACGYSAPGIIQISASHDDPSRTYAAYIHHDISITDNTFLAIRTPVVHAVCVEGLTVTGNTLKTVAYRKALITLRHCKTVRIDEALNKRSSIEDVEGLTVVE